MFKAEDRFVMYPDPNIMRGPFLPQRAILVIMAAESDQRGRSRQPPPVDCADAIPNHVERTTLMRGV